MKNRDALARLTQGNEGGASKCGDTGQPLTSIKERTLTMADSTLANRTSLGHGYAVRITDDAMHPRYRVGELALVDSSMPPADGDDVLVRCKDGRHMVRQLEGRDGASVRLLAIGTGVIETIDASEIDMLALVVGVAGRSASVNQAEALQ